MQRIDHTGQRFGKLTVVGFSHTEYKGHAAHAHWKCRCDCGNETTVNGRYLRNGDTTSCGCRKVEVGSTLNLGKKFGPSPKRKDLTGQHFGRLDVRGVAFTRSHRVFWECWCDCMNWTVVDTDHLLSGHTQSCGCLSSDVTRERNTTHGMSCTPEYNTWLGIQNRCYDKTSVAYHYYGARGTQVCKRWRDSFEAFYTDMGPKPKGDYTIERKESSGNYEPTNCIWLLRSEQNKNRRPKRDRCHKRLITFNGQTLSVSKWAELTGYSGTLIAHKLRQGLPLEEILKKKRPRLKKRV